MLSLNLPNLTTYARAVLHSVLEEVNHGGGRSIESLVAERQDLDYFRTENLGETPEEYLNIMRDNSRATRNAFERVNDMIMSYGTQRHEQNRENCDHYKLYDDTSGAGHDTIFGLDHPIKHLVNAFTCAAKGYGIDKRVLLLHGPVGSSKSTVARMLKKRVERNWASRKGALYTLGWKGEMGEEIHWCPMNEQPLHLIQINVEPTLPRC